MLRDVTLYERLLELAELRGVLTQYMKGSPEAARIAEDRLFGVENSYKVLNGEILALRTPELLKRKRKRERLGVDHPFIKLALAIVGDAFWFDDRYNHTVAMHSGAILEALSKIYRAEHLLREIAGN